MTIKKVLTSDNETRTMNLRASESSEAGATLYVRCHTGEYEGVFTPQNGKLLVWIEWDDPVDITNRWDDSFQHAKEVRTAFREFPIISEMWETKFERQRRDDGSVEYTAYVTIPPDEKAFYQRLTL